jgi:hypothetical protein
MTVKLGPPVADHYANEDVTKDKALRQFILDAALRGIRDALNAAEDVEDFDFVDCSGVSDCEEPWQKFVIHKFKFDPDGSGGDEVTKNFEFRLDLCDIDEGWAEDVQ